MCTLYVHFMYMCNLCNLVEENKIKIKNKNLPTFIHIFQIENNAYASITSQVTLKQSYLGFHKAPL